MTDQQTGKSNKTTSAPATKAQGAAKKNGTRPAVTARRPLSKAEYARTTKSKPDATSVIPAVREEVPSTESAEPTAGATTSEPSGAEATSGAKQTTGEKPAASTSEKRDTSAPGKAETGAKKTSPSAAGTSAPSTDDRPTQMMAAVPADAPTKTPPAAPAPESKAAPARPAAGEPAPATTKAPLQTESKPQARTEESSSEGRSAKLKVRHVEPWSVTKTAFVVSVALMIVSVVAASVFWTVLQITGVWGALNDSVSNVLADDSAGFDVTDYLGFGRIVGLTLLVSSLNVVFMTALATIAAHLYNLAASILGGIEVTFGERD